MAVEIGDWAYCLRKGPRQDRDIPGQMWLSGATVAYVSRNELVALAWFRDNPGRGVLPEMIRPRVENAWGDPGMEVGHASRAAEVGPSGRCGLAGQNLPISQTLGNNEVDRKREIRDLRPQGI